MSSVRHSAQETPEREIRRTMNRNQQRMSRSILEAIRKQHQQMLPILDAIRKQHQQMLPIDSPAPYQTGRWANLGYHDLQFHNPQPPGGPFAGRKA